MLRCARVLGVVCVFLLSSITMASPVALADTEDSDPADPPAHVEFGASKQGKVILRIAKTTTLPGREGGGGRSGNQSASKDCRTEDGKWVVCGADTFYHNSSCSSYCRPLWIPDDSSLWDGYRDAKGQPIGTYQYCPVIAYSGGQSSTCHDPTPVVRPKAGTSPETLVREAVAEIGLHAPTTGVGAFWYSQFSEYDSLLTPGACAQQDCSAL